MKDTHIEIEGHAVRQLLLDQFDIAWALASYHLDGLTTEECLWRPAARCLHVHGLDDGRWQADWPDSEGYEIGPPSIAWTTWHIGFWWTKTLAHLEGETGIEHTQVFWPGSAERVCADIAAFRDRWRALIEGCSASALSEKRATSWPLPDSSLARIAGWLNVELTKNAAEIGVIRFLHATRRIS
jgi:hypothetical protein